MRQVKNGRVPVATSLGTPMAIKMGTNPVRLRESDPLRGTRICLFDHQTQGPKEMLARLEPHTRALSRWSARRHVPGAGFENQITELFSPAR